MSTLDSPEPNTNSHVPLPLVVVILLVMVIQLVVVVSLVCIIMEPQAFRHIYTNLLTSGLVFPLLHHFTVLSILCHSSLNSCLCLTVK